MDTLKGRATALFDAKGRVSLPAKYRKILPEDLVVTKSPDGELPALVLYPSEGFDRWMDEVLKEKGGNRSTNKNLDHIIEKYYQNAEDVKIDSVGRILIPAELREYAEMDKEIIFSGVRDHLIIRSLPLWEKHQKILEKVTTYDEKSAQA